MNNNMHQYIPMYDRYLIFREECIDEGIDPPTFEDYTRRNK